MNRLRVIVGLTFAVIMVFASAAVAPASQAPVPGEYYGVGYWKNHSEYWPAEPIYVGWTSYTKLELTALFAAQPKGDVSYLPAQQMAAAMLNMHNGGGSPFLSPHRALAATKWVSAHPPGSGLSDTDEEWTFDGTGWSGPSLTAYLESYNAVGRPPYPGPP